MPNIKPENEKKSLLWLGTVKGEAVTVAAIGGSLWAFGAALVGYFIRYISQLFYPFSYQIVPVPLHTLLPSVISEPNFTANLLFGMLFALGIYFFEKNIFYRRFNLMLKAAFASVAACLYVFLSGMISHYGIFGYLFMSAEAQALPTLFVYFFLASQPLFVLCNTIRREIFLMP
ncbi:MAG: hypothetical protein ACI3XI_02365 [Eubacteriales bacterium]